MALTTTVKTYMNRCLQHMNLQVDTLTAARQEDRRLQALARTGHFARPSFPVPAAFESMTLAPLLHAIGQYRPRFEAFQEAAHNAVGYTFANHYFTSPDTEVLYTMIRTWQPRTIIEVGCGHSTKIMRQAILDGQLQTRLIAVDPCPRVDIMALTDEFYNLPVEMVCHADWFWSLQEHDMLCIDSSHQIKTGNDVVSLYLQVLPNLPPGVLIHIHDIFLPYEYPQAWVMEKRWGFDEQYLVQALLTFGNAFEVLWPGYFVQQTRPDFDQHFPHRHGRVGTSLWLRKRPTAVVPSAPE